LLILYLQPHWRSEREEVRNSRVLLLADTSLSMGLSDGSAGADEYTNPKRERGNATESSNTSPKRERGHDAELPSLARRASAPEYSRAQQIVAALTESDFLARLRKTHDVTVFQFAEDLNRDGAVTLNKYVSDDATRRIESPPTTDPAPDWAKLLAPAG
jgi:hypothetical protein